MARKREVALRLRRGEVEFFRLEEWRDKDLTGIDASLKVRNDQTHAFDL